jgi:hypothetical protein
MERYRAAARDPVTKYSQKMRDKFKAVLRNDHDSDELFW